MRILVTSFPAYGHLHPLLPLAQAAQALGHEVCVATGPDFIPWVRRCGLRAHAVGLAQAAALRVADQHYPGPQAADHLFADVWVRAALPGLRRLATTWRPDLVLHEEEEYAGPLLAALLGLRCVTHSWPAPARPPHARRTAERLLAAVWDAVLPGAAPRTTGALYLDACPAALQTAALALVPHVVPVRAVLCDGPSRPPPAWLATLAHPAAYLTLGTVPVFSTPQLLGALVAAVSPLLAGLVVTTGPNPVAALGPLPAHVQAARYVPQSQVLSHVDLVISHGGAGDGGRPAGRPAPSGAAAGGARVRRRQRSACTRWASDCA